MNKECSNGPVSTIPGSVSGVDPDDMCDSHPQWKAAQRFQGETDSFGAEYVYRCHVCIVHNRILMRDNPPDESGRCDWCAKNKPRVRERRDYDEGMSGRIYDVCEDCIRTDADKAKDYLRENETIFVDDNDYIGED